MPIYEYRCGTCSTRFETLTSRSDAPTPRCPRCGAASVERQRSTFSVGRAGVRTEPGPCGSADCACRAPLAPPER